MHKIALIIKREYLTRVRKRSFIITTLLFPLLYLGLIFGTAYLGAKSTKTLKIAIIDSSGKFTTQKLAKANGADPGSRLELSNDPLPVLSKNFEAKGFDGYAVIPADISMNGAASAIQVNANKSIGSVDDVQRKLNTIWSDIKYEELGIDSLKKAALTESNIKVNSENLKDKDADAGVASVIGYVAGFLIYLILILYGVQVMMGVVEEKTNRIAEIIVSSVKPFQLMVGKIIGIAMVALTQFLLWVAFIFIIYNATKFTQGASGMNSNELVGKIQNVFTGVNMPLILSLFAFYFLGGFFFYSSLYAAIGSTVNEDMRDAQSLSFPVTMLIIFGIFIMSIATKDPNNPIAVWGSIIPFTSPIVMMARIPFGIPGTVPYWQLIISMLLLVASFLFMAWFSGKIYRTGILMYGKKPTWKEMIKWAFRK